MQDLSNRQFGFAIFMIIGISVFVIVSIINGLETRDKNIQTIDSSINCMELQSRYQQALEFESHYNNNGDSETMTKHMIVKAKEFGCP